VHQRPVGLFQHDRNWLPVSPLEHVSDPSFDVFGRLPEFLMESTTVVIDGIAIMFFVCPIDADEQSGLQLFTHVSTPS
jgi:hypothetical protein